VQKFHIRRRAVAWRCCVAEAPSILNETAACECAAAFFGYPPRSTNEGRRTMTAMKTILPAVLLVLAAGQASAASEYHFKVANSTTTDITKLQVSVDKKSWGDFDVGDGIKAGETETLVWDASTNDEPCEQWIRAKFSDGEWSAPSHQDFCKDMDTPIEFGE
jgi:hypothetical protein